LVVELQLWQPDAPYDRIGLEDRYRDVLGVSVREVVLPVRPGRNMSSIIEIAARNELLRQAGHHPAREFVKNLEQGLLSPERPEPRSLRPPSSQFRVFNPNESSAPPPVTLGSPSSSERKP
jgi:HPr kinase/phosphorylase